MAKRTKPKAEPVLKSWTEVEESLKEIKQIDNYITKEEAYYNERIDDIKNEMAVKAEEKLKRKVRLEKDIQEYAEVHKEEVKSDKMARTKEMANGLIGFRWTPWAIKLAKKKEDVLDLLKQKRLSRWIRIKRDIDKEAVAKEYDSGKSDKVMDKKLVTVGLKRTRKEEFWYTTDNTNAVSAEADAEKVQNLKDVA